MSHLFTDLTDRGVLVVRHAPRAVGSTYFIQEIVDHLRAILCMADLRMKLNSIKSPRIVRDGHMRAGGGMGCQSKPSRNTRHIITVAHPGNALLWKSLKNGAGLIIPRYGFSVLSGGILLCGRYLTAERLGKQLAAVADAKDRDFQFKNRWIHLGRPCFIYAVWTPGKNDTDGGKRVDLLQRHSVWVDLAVDMTFAYPPGNQLIVLPAKIKDQYALHRTSSLPVNLIVFAGSSFKYRT